jgi:chloramphenicol 3-O phosphotransferase
MNATSIILHGPSSSGKSSLAKALQRLWPSPMLHVDLDAFELMAEGTTLTTVDELRAAFRVHCANLQATLRNISASQFSLVLDFVLRDAQQFANCLDALSARSVYLIGVKCDLLALEAPELQRGDRDIGLARAQIGHPEYDRSYDLVIDTTTLSPSEGAQMIWDFVVSEQSAPAGEPA